MLFNGNKKMPVGKPAFFYAVLLPSVTFSGGKASRGADELIPGFRHPDNMSFLRLLCQTRRHASSFCVSRRLLFDPWCFMGVHLTFLNIATIVIGIYVSMNSGNVNI